MPDGPDKYPVSFDPLDLPPIPTDPEGIKQKLENGISEMNRIRAWSNVGNNEGVRTLLGENNTRYIEELLQQGGTRVVEIGGGKLLASKELAKISSNNQIIVVEPYVDETDLKDLPANMKIIRKGIEELTPQDIQDSSIDALFSGGHTWNYIQDKLACIAKSWRILKPGGKAFIEYSGQPIVPPLAQIISKFQLGSVLTIEEVKGGNSVIVIKKSEDKQVGFGNYSFKPVLSSNFPGDVNTYYEFHE